MIPEIFFSNENIIFFANYEELIKIYPSYYKLELEKKEVFLLDLKIFLDGQKDNFTKSYKTIKYLDLLLNRISLDKKDTINHTITYEIVQKKKILIQNFLDFEILYNLDKKLLSLIKMSYNRFNSKNELDKEIRTTFLKKAIEDTFNEEEITFIDVIKKFERLIQQYEIITRAYIEELNTEKVKYDYEKRIQEINEKLSSMIGDIHTKQIILPIAFVIGTAQIKDNTPGSLVFMIFLGLFVFTCLLTMYSNTQKKLVESVKNNINYWEKFYKTNLKTLYKNEIKMKISHIQDIIKKVESGMFHTLLLSWSLIIILMIYLILKYSS
ncbi:hypothetical protein CP985_07625 [Malaciobacter mytili LMG 24559]|uniref:Uncharacterized protein n=1 Tax=Malaciobacter mytili LMG 24559 TaxID=1032238 RepID=A0AAX2AG42_9BACT|nr:hypothetical protein [Malaciobacter mytili]AXH15110.1 putative membrane protein [Malaciobacter mytili LMG 24559]RXK15620.1 hypothetical protein CP985_07625 [Malaciobacter mytili LMG 24559]